MPGKRYGAEQIIPKLREAEVDLAKGLTVAQVCKKIGVTEQTYYRWRKEYGGIRVDQAKRMKDLEKENARLKRLLADAELDKAVVGQLEITAKRAHPYPGVPVPVVGSFESRFFAIGMGVQRRLHKHPAPPIKRGASTASS